MPLEPWQDLYPPTGKCRYCGYPPGPVCGAYKCNEEEANHD